MAARAYWTGQIRLALVSIPVEIFAATKSGAQIAFHQIHEPTGKRVRYEKVVPGLGEVEAEDIVKGYEYEKERYVVLTDADFKRANVEATQSVDIVACVNSEEVAPTYFETPYYLAPDKRGEKGYALLRETLKATNKIAIATVVIRTRQYLAALIPSGNVLVLNTLRYKNELKPAKDLEVPSSNLKASGVSPREIEMAKKLVDEMTDQWKPERYRDTYHDDLMKMINKRIKAGKTEIITDADEDDGEEKPVRGEVIDLMALLKRSVQAKGRSSSQSKRASVKQERFPRRKSA